jgi:DivIVA domain-containing protein
VLGFLVFVVGVLVVAVLLFLGASVLMGRGETQPPAELDRSPVELPDDRPVSGDDVRDLRISVAVRGYRMTEVDWLLEQFADALDERDAEIASLRARLAEAQEAAATPAEPASADGGAAPETADDDREERPGG